MICRKLVSLLILIVASNCFAQEEGKPPTLDAPSSANAGALIEVGFTGAQSEKDFITIVSPQTPEGQYKRYQYTKKNGSVELFVPDEPGKYEIRMLSGSSGYPTLVSKEIEALAVTANVSGPESIAAGATFEVQWEGPNNPRDFVTVVPKGTKEGEYKVYKYTKDSSSRKPLSFIAPESPGEYELRYLSGQQYLTLASHPFVVTGVSASLQVPQKVAAGESFEVQWEGPDNQKDFITIVPKGQKEGTYGPYKYVSRRQGPRKLPIVEMTAPEEPGSYEVRYLSGNKYFTLASENIEVTATSASLDAPEEVVEGSTFEVQWEGPDNRNDYVTIVPVGEKEGKTGSSFRYVMHKMGPRKLPIVELKAPEETGEFELRYVTGGKRFTLASRKIKVTTPSASIDAPDEAVAKEAIEVTWDGPGNDNDYIAITEKGAQAEDAKFYAYVRRGKTLRINTPPTEGDYEIHYVTGQRKKVLASRPLAIVPSKVPGELKVIADANGRSKNVGSNVSVSLILDASGSMLKQEQGEKRIEVAKKAVKKLLSGPLDEGTPFALRVFGHKESDSCRTDLEIPLAPLKKSEADKLVSNLTAKNYAKTPIARSLELVKEDLATAEGKRVVILLTDGEETCDGDPEAAIRELSKSGFETRVNIIGFAIDELMLKEKFQQWARLGNGKYFDASNAQELEQSVLEAIEVPFEVLDAERNIVASGVVNGDAIPVLPGSYTVRVLSSPESSFENVKIQPEMTQELKIAS